MNLTGDKMIKQLISHLSNNGLNFTALVEVQDKKPPFFIYHVLNEQNYHSLNKKITKKHFVFLFEIYATSYKQAEELKEEFEEVIYSFNHPILEFECQRELRDMLHVRSVEVQVIM